MNASAVPWPAATRRIMPTAAAPSHAPRPPGTIASGRRQVRATSQPTASPARNGHAVLARPVTGSPWWWLARPMATKASTRHASRNAAAGGRMRSGWLGRRITPDNQAYIGTHVGLNNEARWDEFRELDLGDQELVQSWLARRAGSGAG